MTKGLQTIIYLLFATCFVGSLGVSNPSAAQSTGAVGEPQQLSNQTHEEPDRVFIVNEGAWGSNNASVTVFYPNQDEIRQQAFYSHNDRLLGDVGNDIQMIDGLIYVVVNNSHKIEVIDPETYEALHTIAIDDAAHGGSPRYIRKVAENKAYVSNMVGNNLSVIDLEQGEVVDLIDLGMGSAPEQLVVSGNYAFVALSGMGSGNEVAVVDIAGDEVVDNIEVGDNPVHIAVAPDGQVWSVATGNYGYDENFDYDPELETFGEIVVIDPQSLTVTDRFETGGHPGRLVFLNDNTALLKLNGIRSIDIGELELEEEVWLDRFIHSFSVDNHAGETVVYATIAPDFASAGSVVRYDASSAAIDSFDAGVGPGTAAFYYKEATDAENRSEQPLAFDLEQNYPNPFNPSTTIRFTLEHAREVSLEVYDLQGRLMATPATGSYSQGTHAVTLDASQWPSGIYLYRLSAADAVQYRKMTLIK